MKNLLCSTIENLFKRAYSEIAEEIGGMTAVILNTLQENDSSKCLDASKQHRNLFIAPGGNCFQGDHIS
jgi:hypothetical protein